MHSSAAPFINSKIGLLATYLVLHGWVVSGSDWPQWRGPERSGVWHEEQFSFPTGALPVMWRVPVGGGYSSPLVASGRVFIFESVLQKPQAWEQVRCLDFNTGQQVWASSNRVNYPDYAFDPKNKAGPNATCVVEAGRIYSIGATGDLFCRDARSGKVIWGTNLTVSCGLRDYSAITPSPLIEGNLLITVPGGESNATVVAFDKVNGEERWRALNDSWTYSSPMVFTADGERQLIVWTQKAVNSLDPTTGKSRWREAVTSSGDMTVSTPVFEQNYLLAGGLMLKLGPGETNYHVLWPALRTETRRVFSNTSTPLMSGELIFTATTSGRLICLNRDTGRPLWETNSVTAAGNGSSMHLTPRGDDVMIFTDQGNLIRARLDGRGYRELNRVHVIDPLYAFNGKKVVWSPPAYANRSVLIRNDMEVLRASFELESPKKN